MSKSHLFITGTLTFSLKKITLTRNSETFFVRPMSIRAGYVHGDVVRARIVKRGGGKNLPEVEVLSLVSRSKEELLGSFVEKGNDCIFAFLPEQGTYKTDSYEYSDTRMQVGDGSDILGDIYVARFTQSGNITILRRFATNEKDDIEQKKLFFFGGIHAEFPSAVLTHAKHIHSTAQDFLAAGDRRDFRSVFTLTIDGADARDLDDAFSLTKTPEGGYILMVHIADVAEYVREDSPLDREAQRRGTSVYTPTGVVPMLPHELSDDLCSLSPGTPKLTLSVIMDITPTGAVTHAEIVESLIQSNHRTVYEEIQKIHETGENPTGDRELYDTIELAYELYDQLHKRRKKEGKIIFESNELVFSFSRDDQEVEKVPIALSKRTRGVSHMLIEEFMVLANEEVAKWCHKNDLPFLSRIHSEPSGTTMPLIQGILGDTSPVKKSKPIYKNQNQGASHISTFRDSVIQPRHIRNFLDLLSPHDLYRYSRLLLPKMSKAIYSNQSRGHFGLALDFYSHFTSPIRRYPDLQVHRIIKEYLHGLTSERKMHYATILPRVALQCSLAERNAENIERSLDALYACRYMQGYIGIVFSGKISGISLFAYFVEIENGVEVTVYLPRYMRVHVDELTGRLVGSREGVIAQIGESIALQITGVMIEERRVLGEKYL